MVTGAKPHDSDLHHGRDGALMSPKPRKQLSHQISSGYLLFERSVALWRPPLITLLWSKLSTKPLTQSFTRPYVQNNLPIGWVLVGLRDGSSPPEINYFLRTTQMQRASPDPRGRRSLSRGIAHCNFVASFLSDIISSEGDRNTAVIRRSSPGHKEGRKENRATQLTPELENCKTDKNWTTMTAFVLELDFLQEKR